VLMFSTSIFKYRGFRGGGVGIARSVIVRVHRMVNVGRGVKGALNLMVSLGGGMRQGGSNITG